MLNQQASNLVTQMTSELSESMLMREGCKKKFWVIFILLIIFLLEFHCGPVFSADDSEISDYSLAVRLIKDEKYREAIPILERALEKYPENNFIKADYLLCLVWTGLHKKAVDYYSIYKERLKSVKYVHRNIAKAFYELGDYVEAEGLYERAILNDQSDGEALKGLIYSLCRLGNYSQAHQNLEEYGQKGILSPKLLTLLKAHIFQKEENYKQAYILYLKSVLTEKKEHALKELQDKRREVFLFLTEDEVSSMQKEHKDDYLIYNIISIDRGKYEDLLRVEHFVIEELPFGFLLELAWGHFKAQRDDEAIEIYQFIIKKWPHSCLARINLVYPLCSKGSLEKGRDFLEWVFRRDCFLINALFAKAFLHEKRKDFLKAIEVYNEILARKPQNISALKLKMRNIADLGATSHAYEISQQKNIKDEQFISALKGDMVLDRLKWKEAEKAIPMLEQQLEDDPANFRARCDYIVALRQKERMKEVVEQFEVAKRMAKPLPYWVTEAMADASLYLERPKEALEFYKITLKNKPADTFNPLMGLFYTYQELRDWKNAERTWEKIEELLKTKRLKKWMRLEAVGAKGWYLAYKDKLKEAQDYFESYLKQAGMNPSFRTGLGHVYIWRGWYRRALEELKIAYNIYPKDAATQNGMVLALNELNYKKEARSLAEKLYKKYPTKKHVQDTYELLQVEDMNEFHTETKFIDEDPGSREYRVKSTLKEPIVPTFKLFQEVVWQETAEETTEGKEEFEWKRAGLGYEWIVVPQLIWKQAFTFDYQKMEEYGYYTILTWLPTDHLKITAGYDSFYLDIPIKARAKGIEGESAFWDVFYHESDLRNYGIASGYNYFDDGNLNSFYKLYYDQSVLNTPDFKIRLGGEIYHARNRKTHVDYFSPEHDLSFVIQPTLHWIHFLRYDKKYRSSLYCRIGFYKQHKYDYHTIGGATFEQLIRLSKTFEFTWNVSWDRKVYDGESTDVWGGFCAFRKSF